MSEAVVTSEETAVSPDWLRRSSVWLPDGSVELTSPAQARGDGGIPWFELVCGPNRTESAFELLAPCCPGLTPEMLEDLLTPDDEPEGRLYADGAIQLASTFSVVAQRPDEKLPRGTPQGAGVLVFQPVELLAADDWLVSCWHPRRTFQGANKTVDDRVDRALASLAQRRELLRGR